MTATAAPLAKTSAAAAVSMYRFNIEIRNTQRLLEVIFYFLAVPAFDGDGRRMDVIM